MKSVPEEYLPASLKLWIFFCLFVLGFVGVFFPLNLWKLCALGLLKKPCAFDGFFWWFFFSFWKAFSKLNTAFLQEISPFTSILTMLLFRKLKKKGGLCQLLLSFFLLTTLKITRVERKLQLVLLKQLSPGPPFLGHASLFNFRMEHAALSGGQDYLLVSDLRGYSWVQARMTAGKSRFSQETQSFLLRAGAPQLHPRPILAFRWAK